MFRPTGILFLFLSVLWGCTADPHSPQENVIDFSNVPVEGGRVSGTTSNNGEIQIFKGIPFAAAPTGDLRWKAPAPVPPWDGVKSCDSFGPSPMQRDPEPFYVWTEEFLIAKQPIDEDCLYLNVWTGAESMDEKRPVVVWIPGGGFVSGSGSVPIYDGEAMAEKGVVFVTINYRLGIFGFFSHPELTRESPHNASGNYGLLDQIAALTWVKQNIKAFGGDPDNFTIAGQSAGSASVVFLVASPLAKGLFQKAIAQSGAGLLSREPGGTALMNLAEAELSGQKVASDLQATSIAQLRNIPAGKLQDKGNFRAHPIVDGYVLPESATKIYLENKQNKVSLLTGWNQNEGVVMGEFESADEFKERMKNEWGATSGELLILYPASSDSIAAISQKTLQRDVVFGAQNYALANLVSSQGNEVYVYRFARQIPGRANENYGAFHTGEVPYAYDNLEFVDRPFETIDFRLADIMSSYWMNFITSGNPNAEELPNWPKYSTNSRDIMFFGEEPQRGIITDTANLNFLQEHLMRK